MLGYFLILALTVIVGLNADVINQNKKNKKYFIIFVFGMMILFAVLRGYRVAIDYSTRATQMKLLFDMSFSEVLSYTDSVQDGEYLYTLFIWLISRIIKVPWMINGLLDIFVLSTFAWFFYRYSKDVTFASLMFIAFVFTAALNITRQYVAVSCFLIALHFLIQKKPFKALIPLVAAMLIHSSAKLLFAIYILYFIGFRINRKKMMIFFIAVVGAFLAFDRIVDLFVQLFPQYTYYTKSEWAVGTVSFSVLWLVIYLALFFLMFLSLPSAKLQNKTNMSELDVSGLIMVCFILYAVISLLQSRIWFISRINAYFIFGYCMIIPEILERLKLEKRGKSVAMLFLKCGVAVWAVSMFLQNGHGILPYEFIWETVL